MQFGKCGCQLLMTPFHRFVLNCLIGLAVLLMTFTPLLTARPPEVYTRATGQNSETRYVPAIDLNAKDAQEPIPLVIRSYPYFRKDRTVQTSNQEKMGRFVMPDTEDPVYWTLDSKGYGLYKNSKTRKPYTAVTSDNRSQNSPEKDGNSNILYSALPLSEVREELYRNKSRSPLANAKNDSRAYASKSQRNDGMNSARAAIVRDLYRQSKSLSTITSDLTQSSNEVRSISNLNALKANKTGESAIDSKIMLRFNISSNEKSALEVKPEKKVHSNVTDTVQENGVSSAENKTQVVYTVADLIEFLRTMKRRIAMATGESARSRNSKEVDGTFGRRNDKDENDHPNTEQRRKYRGFRGRLSLFRKPNETSTVPESRVTRSESERNPVVRRSRSRKVDAEDSNSTSSPIIRIRPKTLFNYTYHISAVERGSVFPHDPLQGSIDREDLFPSPHIIVPLVANKTSPQTNSPKSVYESLKPRLKSKKKSSVGSLWHPREANFNPTKVPLDSRKEPSLSSDVTSRITRQDTKASTNSPSRTTTSDSTSQPSSSDSFKPDGFMYRNLPVPKRMDSEYEPIPTTPMPIVVPVILKKIGSSEQSPYNTSLSNYEISTDMTETPTTIDPITAPEMSDDSQNLIPSETTINPIPNNSKSIPTNTPDPTTTLDPSSDTRRPKMTSDTGDENAAVKKLDQKSFYEYLLKAYATGNGSLPEYRPGRYDELFPRKAVLDIYFPRPTPFFKVRTSPATQAPDTTPFESRRTSIRVSSTFYPNRMQDVTLRFGPSPDSTSTTPTTPREEESAEDEAELRELEAGFTMEKLAYLLIGTCCGLSIFCLLAVIGALRCRRFLLRRRLRKRLGSGPVVGLKSAWTTHGLGSFPDSARSSAGGCSCHCVGWSLGPRNLESSSGGMFLCGQKKLPFGAASTLRYESMLGRPQKPPHQQLRQESSESSQEHDSLEQDSDSSGDGRRCCNGGPRKCTCIRYAMWPMVPDMRPWCQGAHYLAGDCGGHPPLERLPMNCPPPVTGSNYLDRSEGVVYWSSNDERLI